jgi:hypothetical protein
MTGIKLFDLDGVIKDNDTSIYKLFALSYNGIMRERNYEINVINWSMYRTIRHSDLAKVIPAPNSGHEVLYCECVEAGLNEYLGKQVSDSVDSLTSFTTYVECDVQSLTSSILGSI